MKLIPTFIPARDRSSIVLKKSFNEDVVIEFNASDHTYFYEGIQLSGATDLVKKYYKPFDLDIISKTSAKAWGVEQNEVKDIWDSNGSLTSGFGTIVHQALEHYNKFKSLGEKISKKKELAENYCLPKHPVLKNIVEGFIALNKSEGLTYSEILVSNVNLGLSGQADLLLVLDEEKKICRVQDYKININSEELNSSEKPLAPFNDLPANKLTKYQLQMSIYANMLEASGWVVEGLDVFVFEDTWKHYPLSVLNVIK